MPLVTSGLKGKNLQSQTREVINKVLKFMENEVVQGSLTIPIQKAQLRVEKGNMYHVAVYSK
jgi:hypothetical protein